MKNESEPEEENSKYEPEIIKKSETLLEDENEKRISEDEENISENILIIWDDEENISENSQVNSEDENDRNDDEENISESSQVN